MNAATLRIGIRVLALLLVSGLMFAPVACDSSDKDKSSEDDEKDDDDDSEDDDDDKGKKRKKKGKKKGRTLSGDDDDDDDDDSRKSRGAVDGPSAGAILAYMPADCTEARAYVNTAALFSDTSAQKVLREITTKILSKQRSADAQKAIEVLKKSGFDLATGIREIAMCTDAGGDDPLIGLSLSVPDPLGLLEKVAEAMGESKLPITKRGNARILTADDVTFVQPASGILVFGKKAKAEASIEKAGASGFVNARGQVGYFRAKLSADSYMEGKMTRAAANFNLWGVLKLDAKAADAAKGDPNYEKNVRDALLEKGEELKNGPFKLVLERLKTATVQLKGDKIVVTMSIPTSDVTALLKAAAPQLGVRLGTGGGGSQPPVSGEQDPLDELLRMMKRKK